jgi:translation initiation factor eIF-2B subunit beta
MYDYVAPELVSLFVTDTGGYQGSYVYRLLAEYYTRDDYMLSEDFLDQLVYSS